MWSIKCQVCKVSWPLVHCTFSISHFTPHTLKSTLYTPHLADYIPHSTLHSTLHTLQYYTLHNRHFTSHSTLDSLHFTLHYAPHFELRTPHFTLRTPHPARRTSQSPRQSLHTIRSPLITPFSSHPYFALHIRLHSGSLQRTGAVTGEVCTTLFKNWVQDSVLLEYMRVRGVHFVSLHFQQDLSIC